MLTFTETDEAGKGRPLVYIIWAGEGLPDTGGAAPAYYHVLVALLAPRARTPIILLHRILDVHFLMNSE